MLYNEDCRIKTVDDMFKYSSTNALPLLSNYNVAFWGNYIINFERYDKIFRDMYKSFKYFNQEPYTSNNTIDIVTTNFIDDVYGYLMLNEKRWTKLFQIELLNSNVIENDFYTEEILRGGKKTDSTYKSGSRKDSGSEVLGSRTESGSGSTTDNYGNTNGTSTEYIKAFDSATLTENSMRTDVQGSHIDTSQSTSQNTIGSQTNSNTFNKGLQTDTESKNENNNQTIITKGYNNNPNDNIEKFIKTWDGWAFYKKIFMEIASDLLLV